ncbi:Very-long-chain (3R)-3-hydroxyacyl-CoA dehydratase [Paragonimus heterotremus]|uniref:Very-long-chain (3R)-3-hydroxyacyl-CoA dehydratase n=1 Tax=Paragonimus heterotremus TaxID=100268 RepID=A0A8J4SUV7_9TREM|nr:Very-long-chain (3R)-3-hydroxyacyl-CoA dehydratase [Paragonimus heterotremus]
MSILGLFYRSFCLFRFQMSSSTPVHPFVKWGQNETHVYLSVQLSDVENVKVNIEDETLTFSAIGNGSHGRGPYEFKLDYFLPVIAQQSRYTITGRAVVIRLRKELRETWSRLTIQSERLPWARLDFDLYQFDVSDLEQSDTENVNLGVKVIHPTKEERERHNAEMKALEDEEEWEAFIKILKNPLTIYLLLFNMLQFAGFLCVCGMLVRFLLTGGDTAKNDWYGMVIDRLVLVQLIAFLEPLHVLLRWVRGGLLASLFQVLGRALVLFLIILPHESLHSETTVFWLFFVWSAVELVRYPFYILSLLGFRNGLLTYLRYTVWIPLYPIGFICEGKQGAVDLNRVI